MPKWLLGITKTYWVCTWLFGLFASCKNNGFSVWSPSRSTFRVGLQTYVLGNLFGHNIFSLRLNILWILQKVICSHWLCCWKLNMFSLWWHQFFFLLCIGLVMPVSPPPLVLWSLHSCFIDVLHLENYYNVNEHIGVLFIMVLQLLLAFMDGIIISF